MSVNNQYQNVAYGLNQALLAVAPLPIISQRPPTTADTAPLGQLWIDVPGNLAYVLTSIVANSATWVSIAGGAGSFASLTVTPGPTSLTGAFTVIGNGNAIQIGNDAHTNTTTIGSVTSTSATTLQSGSGALHITSTNGPLTIDSGTGALGISTDAAATTVSFATGGAVKAVTLGSVTSTSSTTVQSGSGSLNVTSTNGALTIDSGTGALGISTDAAVTTLSIGTGGAAKTVNVGSTNTTSATTIQSGSGGIELNATAGNVSVLTATNSSATTTVVLSSRVGIATYTGQTTASAATLILTLTNTFVTATSAILMTVMNVGANDARMSIEQILPSASSVEIILINNGTQALNGNVTIAFWVLN